MLEYDRIDISERIDVNKTNAPKNVIFVIISFKYEPYLCYGLMQKSCEY